MKSMFTSKTFWVNVVALVAMIIQATTNSSILVSVETQASVLAFINIILRSITKDAVTWK